MCRLLSWLANEERPDLALAVFDWMESRPEYHTRDRVLYTRLLSMFARQRDGLPQAMQMFDRMRSAGIQPDIVAFNAAIRAAGKQYDVPLSYHRLEVTLCNHCSKLAGRSTLEPKKELTLYVLCL